MRVTERVDSERVVPVSRVLAWAFLLGFILLVGVAKAAYAGYGTAPSSAFEVLAILGLMTFMWHWVTQECRPCGATFPLDFAWFVGIL
jgi:hypothetical protein